MGTVQREFIVAHLTHHTTRLVTEPVRERYTASVLTVFLTFKSFALHIVNTRFTAHTANIFDFPKAYATL